MVRSAMSSGANYEEARGAGSRADFCNKLQISLKEMRETPYWLVLTERAGLIVKEATELRAIPAKAVATVRGKAEFRRGVFELVRINPSLGASDSSRPSQKTKAKNKNRSGRSQL